MKNWEKYEKDIKRLGINNIAVSKTGEVIPCDSIGCVGCKFSDDVIKNITRHSCYKNMVDWLYEEYKEPEMDWSKVPVDTPIYVRDEEGQKWQPRYFADYKDGKVYTWIDGKTSFTVPNHWYAAREWRYAKLSEGFNERD